MASADRPMSRRTGIVLIVVLALLFVVELVALATGQLVVAVVCAGLFTAAWFAMRSYTKRRGG